MSRWTEQQVLDLAPDASSVTAARKLATPGPWSEAGASDALVWGQCQGSGSKPYQVSIDLNGPAYRCSCPSRKFPCKHALALLLLWAADAIGASGEVAGHARSWIEGREARAAGKPADGAPATLVDPEVRAAAAAKRLAERLATMDAGAEEFRLWLGDAARTGLAGVRDQPYAWWDAAAARLVDGQMPRLAEEVREAASLVRRGSDWAEELVRRFGRWWLLTEAWQRRDGMDEAEFADLRVELGWAQPSAAVRENDPAPGPWGVLGAHRDVTTGGIREQRTWLRGPDGEVVQVLDFSAGGGPALPVAQLAGARLDVALARYPGLPPQRALFLTDPAAAPGSDATTLAPDDFGTPVTIREAFSRAAAHLDRAPWKDRFPVVLAGVRVAPAEQENRLGPALVDAAGDEVLLAPDEELDTLVLTLMAHTGGHPRHVFGELEGGRFRPLSLVGDGTRTAVAL